MDNKTIEALQSQQNMLEEKILAIKIQQRQLKPKPRFIDGMGVIEKGFYGRNYITEIIAGSGCEEDPYYGLQLMRGCKHCLKNKYSFSYGSSTWGGYAVAVTKRYLRRYYQKTVFFGEELMDIIYPLIDRFPISHSTISAYIDCFRIIDTDHSNDYRIIFKGKTFFMEKDRYDVCKSTFKQMKKLTQLEEKYNEIKKIN